MPVALIAWWIIYHQLPMVTGWLTYHLFSLGRGTHLGEAIAFFFYDVPKVLMLLILVVFGVGTFALFLYPGKDQGHFGR